MSRYNKCPVCDKKGLYSDTGNFYRDVICKYCGSRWATHKWTAQHHQGECPECECKPFNDGNTVFPHYCKLPDESIHERIEKIRKRYETMKDLE